MRICPHCRKALVALEYRDIEMDWCPACRGAWLDRGELGLLLHGDPAAEPALVIQTGRAETRRCPRCEGFMRQAEIDRTGVVVDSCPHGHGIWFDAGEIRAVINAVSDEPGLADLSDFCEGLFGAAST